MPIPTNTSTPKPLRLNVGKASLRVSEIRMATDRDRYIPRPLPGMLFSRNGELVRAEERSVLAETSLFELGLPDAVTGYDANSGARPLEAWVLNNGHNLFNRDLEFTVRVNMLDSTELEAYGMLREWYDVLVSADGRFTPKIASIGHANLRFGEGDNARRAVFFSLQLTSISVMPDDASGDSTVTLRFASDMLVLENIAETAKPKKESTQLRLESWDEEKGEMVLAALDGRRFQLTGVKLVGVDLGDNAADPEPNAKFVAQPWTDMYPNE